MKCGKALPPEENTYTTSDNSINCQRRADAFLVKPCGMLICCRYALHRNIKNQFSYVVTLLYTTISLTG